MKTAKTLTFSATPVPIDMLREMISVFLQFAAPTSFPIKETLGKVSCLHLLQL